LNYGHRETGLTNSGRSIPGQRLGRLPRPRGELLSQQQAYADDFISLYYIY
jgi:hypothetical protein